MIDILFMYPPYQKRAGGGTIFPLGIGYLISGIEKNGFSFNYIDCQNLYCKKQGKFIDNIVREIKKNKYLVISCDISLKRGRKEEIYDEMKELMYKRKLKQQVCISHFP